MKAISAEVIDAMVASGCTAEQIGSVVKAALASDEMKAAERREKDKLRKRAERAAANPSEVSSAVQDVQRTDEDITDTVDTVSLSPVPLLSPTPPNNPLTPKPIQKNNSARGIRLPEDWVLTGPDLAYAVSKGLSEQRTAEVFEKFCNWAWSASGPNAVKRNWHRAWQNWILTEIERPQPRAGPNGQPRATTVYQQNQLDTKAVLNELELFASGRSGGSQADPRFLPRDSGERSEGVRRGAGPNVVELPSTSGRAGR